MSSLSPVPGGYGMTLRPSAIAPRVLALIAVSGVCALVAGALWVFLVGCCVIAASICLPDRRSDEGLPDPEEIWDLEVRSTALQLRTAEQRYLAQLHRSSGALKPHLRAARAHLRSLEHQVAVLLRRADTISRFLAQARSRTQVEEDVRQLEQRVARTSDAAARCEYELALASRRRQLASICRIEAEQQLVQASLERVVSAIEALPTQIMELDLVAESSAATAREELRQALAHVDDEMAATSESLSGGELMQLEN